MICFSKINSFDKGQRESFEDLICVLARRERLENAVEYQANDGCGGDGGVEALWLLSNGKKIGYQAKFFLDIEDSQWQQMDDSVKTALKIHPQLQRYIIAIPRDLTPEKAGKGKSQRQKWDTRLEKWKGWAQEKAINIEFELWSETILKEMMLREENAALIKHWFGGDVLNNAWFSKKIDVAKQTLDDRFNPDDHVEVSIESLFDTMARGPAITQKLEEAFNKIPNFDFSTITLPSAEITPFPNTLLDINKSWQEVQKLSSAFSHDLIYQWKTDSASKVLEYFIEGSWTINAWAHSIDKNKASEEEERQADRLSNSFLDAHTWAISLSEILENEIFQAEASQCAVIYGPAGAGKSHILGQIAAQRTRKGFPTILVLGQSLSNLPFWEQVAGLLGLEGRAEEDVLGNLNAAGERKRERTFLLFDAINEGVGSQYWLQNLPQIIKAIQDYPYLSAIFSCRDEYLPYAIPESLSKTLPKFQIKGFSTPKELERAAIQYLDKKGIARPNTPWLSPEFSNPLFIKTVSEALHVQGKKEFPRGLNGISQVMAMYLDALSWRTGIDTDTKAISISIKQSVNGIAQKMAMQGHDYVEMEEAVTFSDECFKYRTPPEGKTWLDVLIQTSVFRRDPAPFSKDIDPFDPPSERIRFAFQRFQDHLMAKALVSKITKDQASAAFSHDGVLHFLFFNGQQESGFRYQYAGLISALSTIYPEKFEVEFAQTLPNWAQCWEKEQLLQQGFAESFKWRSTDAFSDATRELLNNGKNHDFDVLGLLLDVSMGVAHPYNALKLHAHLKQLKMPERDSYWTRWINGESREDLNQVERIVSWALSVRVKPADVKHLELASLVLVWSFSSSHMTLRDRATKALTTLFLKEASIFNFVLEKIHDCDDPYVIERLYAAAYGACCINPNLERLKIYSANVFTKVFANRLPPVALLTRDYALGIMELADSKGALGENIHLTGCYPPFDSDAPLFELTKEGVKKIAEDSGGKEIYNSASSEWGDFGKYSIPSCVDNFLTTPLNQAEPKSKDELKQLFVEQVISPYEGRIKAFERYEVISELTYEFPFNKLLDDCKNKEEIEGLINYEELKIISLQILENLLSEEEGKRFSKEYLREDAAYESFKKIDVQQCRLWITKRTYELGWNSKLFPNDGYGGSYSRHENDLERIGKKYQRIALDEIQARLADNFWMHQGYDGGPYVYLYSHIDFRRDLDPTILPSEEEYSTNNDWIVEPKINLPDVAEKDLKQWPFLEDPTQSMDKKLLRVDEDGKRWLVLYEYNADKQKYQDDRGEHGARYEEFRFFYCVFVKSGKGRAFAKFLERKQSLDVSTFSPNEFTDGPYLREAHWRKTWDTEKFSKCLNYDTDDYEFAIPIAQYHWESHLDKSLPNGSSCYMPQKWFTDELGLSMSENTPKIWLNNLGSIVIQAREFDQQKAVVIDEDTLCSYAEKFNIEPIWLMIAERNTWPNGNNSHFCRRRSEGAIWFEDGAWKQVGWNKDYTQ